MNDIIKKIKGTDLKEKNIFNKDESIVINFSSINNSELNYSSSKFLNVPIVNQKDPDGIPNNMCWAADVASIVNYKNGRNLTAINVCDTMGYQYNQGGNAYDTQYALNHYSIPSTALGSTMSEPDIVSDISNNKPAVIGLYSDYGIGHSVVLCGYASYSSAFTLSVMDSYEERYSAMYYDSTIGRYYLSGASMYHWYFTVRLN
jgi:hypothetical protein